MNFNSEYMEIMAVVPKPEGLDFLFRNGDIVHLQPEELALMVREGYSGADWARTEVLEFGSAVSVPANPKAMIVSVVRIRERTDPRFAAHLQSVALDQCAHIGRMLRSLRESAGLNLERLAAKVRITADLLADIEQGHPALYDHMDAILEAMGKDRTDLAGS